MRLRVETKVITNRFPDLKERLPQAVGVLVEKHGKNAEAIAKRLSRVDTGEMRDGWDFHMTSVTDGELVNPVAHTPFNEFGTINMAAQPMLRPAVEQTRGPLLDDLSNLERILGK